MKIFVWQGDGVLTDYTDGMIVAVAADLEEALETIKSSCPHAMGSFPPIPTESVDIGPVFLTSRAWVCWGGG